MRTGNGWMNGENNMERSDEEIQDGEKGEKAGSEQIVARGAQIAELGRKTMF